MPNTGGYTNSNTYTITWDGNTASAVPGQPVSYTVPVNNRQLMQRLLLDHNIDPAQVMESGLTRRGYWGPWLNAASVVEPPSDPRIIRFERDPWGTQLIRFRYAWPVGFPIEEFMTIYNRMAGVAQ
jgi:hypothetical protein